MARKDRIKEDGRAFEIRNIRVITHYKHPDYVLHHGRDASMSATGEWSIFRLEHSDGHWYRGRWDEKQSALDIDLFKGRNAPKLYKRFQGHHTQQRPDPNVREFDVDLKFHGLDIFRGSVGFNLGRRIAFEEKIVLSDLPITASLQRRSWVGKLWGYPVECWRRFTRLFSRKRRA